MTSPQIGREMAAARAGDLRREAERQRLVRAASAAASRVRATRTGPAAAVRRPARWLVRLVGASLTRH